MPHPAACRRARRALRVCPSLAHPCCPRLRAPLLQASFVTTWMEPDAERLISESLNVNFVDTEEYPSSTEIHDRCVESKDTAGSWAGWRACTLRRQWRLAPAAARAAAPRPALLTPPPNLPCPSPAPASPPQLRGNAGAAVARALNGRRRQGGPRGHRRRGLLRGHHAGGCAGGLAALFAPGESAGAVGRQRLSAGPAGCWGRCEGTAAANLGGGSSPTCARPHRPVCAPPPTQR